MLNELALTAIVPKAHCGCISMFANISYIIPSSFENEELTLFDPVILELCPIELEPWLEDEAITSK
jgi:hypothetical protein